VSPRASRSSVGFVLLGALLLAACGGNDAVPPPPKRLSVDALMDPETCSSCHPKAFEQWSSSMHAYASDDPLFRAMNARGQRAAGVGSFCVKCHAPVAVALDHTTDGLNLDELPAKERGITCYFCHNVVAVRGTHDNPLVLAGDAVMRGEIRDPVESQAHGAVYSEFHDRDRLESAQLCGSCHDIVNGHGTSIERTFDEWQKTVFATPEIGTTCGQCHMDQSKNLEPVAVAPGVFSRRSHDHRFPAVDQALTDLPGAAELAAANQALLDTTLQSALCLQTIPSGSSISVILDNVAGGHSFPSGAAQDRRAWVEVTAYAGDEVVYQSGNVAPGDGVTDLDDADLWLIRDCLFDGDDTQVHMFWEAQDYESNLLPGQITFDRSDPRFYQTHVVQRYPRKTAYLSTSPDRVTLRVYLQPFGLDVFDDLVASDDLADTDAYSVAELRAKLVPYQLGETLEWTAATATEEFVRDGLPYSCISTTNLNASADKVPAVNHVRCQP